MLTRGSTNELREDFAALVLTPNALLKQLLRETQRFTQPIDFADFQQLGDNKLPWRSSD